MPRLASPRLTSPHLVAVYLPLCLLGLPQMCGIFGYLNYLTPKQRSEILRLLVRGLQRLEYRGYDSAGVGFDNSSGRIETVKSDGNVQKLIDLLTGEGYLSDHEVLETHVGIAHTRWATHGAPNPVNSHPHRSDPDNEFVVVHNGIITNYREIRLMLERTAKMTFESETDTEVFAKLLKFIHDGDTDGSKFDTLADVVRAAVRELDGSFAFLVKSSFYPGEIVATRRGSPLIVGIVDENNPSHIELSTQHRPSRSRSCANPAEEPISASPARALVMAGVDDLSMASPTSPQRSAGSSSSAAAAFETIPHTPREFFFSSDAAAIIEHTRQVVFLEDGDIFHVRHGHLRIYNVGFDSAQEMTSAAGGANRVVSKLSGQLDAIMKGNYEHFMQKEIFEQPESSMNTMRGRIRFDAKAQTGSVRLGGITEHMSEILSCRSVTFLACGTSYHACLATRQVFEELSGLPAHCELASEFVDRNPNVFRDEMFVFVSQSGETADTLRALRYVKCRKALACGVTNTVGSAIARETDFGVHVNAGIEIGVASTKAYTSQIIAILLIALQLSEDSIRRQERRQEIIRDLVALPTVIQRTLQMCEPCVKELAKELKGKSSMLVFGRGYNYSSAMEGALKVKEISYIHTEGLSSSELKHGPIALVSQDTPCIIFATRDFLFPNVMSALEQLHARKGHVIAICNENDEVVREKAVVTVEVPKVTDCLACIVNIIPLQLLSYHLAVELGLNVDQPRNLAKSVVV